MTPCSLVDGYRHFQETCFLYLQSTEFILLTLRHLEPNLLILKMENLCYFEAPVSICKIKPCYNPDHHHLNSLPVNMVSIHKPSVNFILLVSVWPTLTPQWLDSLADRAQTRHMSLDCRQQHHQYFSPFFPQGAVHKTMSFA
jgi:hypothetical protein